MQQDEKYNPPSRLVRLFEICADKAVAWSESDLKDIFQHQLSMSLMEELQPAACEFHTLNLATIAPDQQMPHTFSELFAIAHPPIALLRLAKDYAKQADAQADDSLPPEVASALYTLSIAAALVRLNERITAMNDDDLRRGFDWVFNRWWIDAPSRDLAKQALAKLNHF
jgi:hypothetical protein